MSGPTTVAFGDPKAQKKWSGALFLDVLKKSYFDRKFVNEADTAIIQRLTDLESEAGDTISFDLSVQLRNKPTRGDARLQGKEEALRFFTDTIKIDQLRHGVSAGGKMSRKRTVHDMRSVAKSRLSDYWSAYTDQLHFIYLSGARGVNADFYEDVDFTGHAGNTIDAPDADHLIYGGNATSKASVDSSDKMAQAVIERANVKARTMRALNPEAANMLPIDVEGDKAYVCLMSPFQAYDLRIADTTGWPAIQKQLITAAGVNTPIFKGGLGMIDGTVLHEHDNVITFSDYGAGSNVEAARALLLGRQAGVVAYGSAGGLRYSWSEEMNDHGNEPTVAAGFIGGVKKTRFNSKDFGVLSIDTAAADPNG